MFYSLCSLIKWSRLITYYELSFMCFIFIFLFTFFIFFFDSSLYSSSEISFSVSWCIVSSNCVYIVLVDGEVFDCSETINLLRSTFYLIMTREIYLLLNLQLNFNIQTHEKKIYILYHIIIIWTEQFKNTVIRDSWKCNVYVLCVFQQNVLKHKI